MKRIAIAAGFAFLLPFIACGCSSEDKKARAEREVKESLMKDGVLNPIEPTVELSQTGDGDWVGTATFGPHSSLRTTVVYDIKYNGRLVIRTERYDPRGGPKIGPPPASTNQPKMP